MKEAMSHDHEAPLPDVHDKVLEGRAVEEWIHGVRECGALHEIVVRGGGAYSDAPIAVTERDAAKHLDDAMAHLRKGASVQLRYHFDGVEWWDTLMPLVGGKVRLVRIDRSTLDRRP
jgi:hypothetical protein